MTDQSELTEAPNPEDTGSHLAYKNVSAILYAVDIEDRAQLIELMEPLHAADIADLLEQIYAFDRSRLIRLYDREFDGDILSELDEGIREEVIAVLKPHVLADAVRDLDSDDVVDLVEDLGGSQQEVILDALPDADRAMVEQALSYPEYSAGRLMQREVVMAPEHWNVGEAIDHLRGANENDLPTQFYHLVLIDPRLHPVGTVTLGKLMRSRREGPLSSLIEDTFQIIPASQDEGDVAYAFNQYHLISAPVVDDEGRLIGQITHQIIGKVQSGAAIVMLDAAAPHAGKLPERDDVSYFVTHPCHPPIFNDETEPAAKSDFFGGIHAKQHIVCALMQGPEEDYARCEEVARRSYAPVMRSHRCTVEQLAILEPALSETVGATLALVLREATDEAVRRGVPEQAAHDFMMGHLNIELAIAFGIFPGGVFSDGALHAIDKARPVIFKEGWMDAVFDPDAVMQSVKDICDAT